MAFWVRVPLMLAARPSAGNARSPQHLRVENSSSVIECIV
jgi:hypothetical protein